MNTSFPIKPRRIRFGLHGARRVIASSMFLLAGSLSAPAFTSNEAETAYNAWWNAFSSGGIGFWTGAETVEMVIDVGKTADINTMCGKFTSENGTNWSSNSFNDDIAWACIAFTRAYQATGNTSYRTIAKDNFDMMFARAWDSAGGGGIWWNTNNTYKASASNFPSAIAAWQIYLATGDTNYETKAHLIFNWGKARFFNDSSGKVYDGYTPSNNSTNTTSYSYNQGTFAGAAYFCGDSVSAFKSGDYVKDTWGVTLPVYGLTGDGAGFNGICLRWLGKIGYDPAYRQAVADNAWARRDPDNLVSCQWDKAYTGEQNGWGCTNMVVAMHTVAANGDGVILCELGHYYGGLSQRLAPGSYNLSQLQTLGVSNDWVSSARVPEGFKITMYEHDNFGGSIWTLTSDTGVLGANEDEMSSCVIELTGAIFFEDTDYGGFRGDSLAAGSYTLAQLQALGVSNDWVSSAKLPSGWSVVMFKDDDFHGDTWTLTSDSSDLGVNDNALSSCIVTSPEDPTNFATHRYFRFTPVKLRDDSASDSVQISELEFLFNGNPLSFAGVAVTNPEGNNPAGETVPNLIDGNTATKWLDFYKTAVVFDFGTTVAIDGYRFATANDATERDPVRWTLEGSNDGNTWTVLDNVTSDIFPPTNRGEFTPDFALPAAPSPVLKTWTAGDSADWNTLSANWDNGAAVAWDNGDFVVARFDGTGSSTVSLTEPITARVLDFALPRQLVQGGTLTLDGVTRLTAEAPAEVASDIAGNVGLVKTGPSVLSLSGANSYSGTTFVREGTLEFTGAASKTSAGPLTVGDREGKGVLILSGTGSVIFDGIPYVGGNTGVSGAIRQSACTATFAEDTRYLTLASGTGSYGTYEISGGSLMTPSGAGIRVGRDGEGVFEQSGGDVTCSRWFSLGGNNGTGIATFTGGTAAIDANYRMVIGDSSGGLGVVNLGTAAGGDALVTPLRNATGANDGGVTLSNAGSSTGFLNLNSGVLELNARIYRAGGSGSVHLNGGTLRAGTDNVELINTSLTAVKMFNGGLTVDTDGLNASISANISATSGKGVYISGGTLSVGSGGSGYIGAPVVTVTSDGTGTGAMAVAAVSGGGVTSVSLTCPGEGYLEGDTLAFSFSGGGFDSAAPGFEYVLSANDVATNNAGGLTKTGAGNLVLSGGWSHTGPTQVFAGTLTAGLLDNTIVTVSPGASLAGNVNTQGPVIIQGTLAPGNSVGIATGNSSLELAAGSTYAVEITDWNGAAGVGFDTASFATVATAATSGSLLTVAVDGTGITGFAETPRDFVIASATDSAPTGFAADNWQVTSSSFPGTGTWSVAVVGNDVVLSYAVAIITGYDSWMAGFTVSDATSAGDPEFDGIANLMEYVLNGSPEVSSTDVLPTASVVGENYVFAFVRRAESQIDTVQTFQYGSDLGAWTDVPIPAATAGDVTIDVDTPSAGLETVTVTVPTSSEENGRLFGRLKVAQP